MRMTIAQWRVYRLVMEAARNGGLHPFKMPSIGAPPYRNRIQRTGKACESLRYINKDKG
jgi:hypothetical protein